MLVGNGLSIAFNPSLALPALTEALIEKVSSLASDESAAIEVLNRLVSSDLGEQTFEKFVGHLDESNINTETLLKLAKNLSPSESELHDSITRTSQFANTLRDWGVSIVLETIHERSQIDREERALLDRLLGRLGAAFPDGLVFGNLNYDTMLLTAMLSTYGSGRVADLASGRATTYVTSDSRLVSVRSLRKVDDFPKSRILHLNLHGSLQFWADENRTTFVKLENHMLADGSQWRSVRDGTTNIRPVVVLTNQKHKTDAVREFPFSIAYTKFGSALNSSPTWLVIGYSFTDRSVNELLTIERVFAPVTPKVIVVTMGKGLTRKTIERAFGWKRQDHGSSSEWLTIFRRGAKEFSESPLLDDIATRPSSSFAL